MKRSDIVQKMTALFEEQKEGLLVEGKGIGQFTLKRTGRELEAGPNYDDEVEITLYDILHKNKKVGSLRYDRFMGSIYGDLYGKDLPNLDGYARGKGDSKPLSNLHSFLKSKTGRRWATTGALRGKNILEEERNDRVYYDESPDQWALDSKVVNFANGRGYALNKMAGIIRIKGSEVRSEMHLFEPNSSERIQAPAGLKVFRYATEATVAGGIMPLIAVNFKRNLVYFLDQEAADMGEVKFEGRGERLEFGRFRSYYAP